MRRVVVVLVLLAAAAAGRSVSVSTAADPAVVGQWSAVINWPAVGVHSHLLNTGRVLTWETGSQATVFDPATGLFNPLPNPWADLLCSGHAFLPDGRLISIGGWDRSGAALGLTEVDIFDPSTQSWIRGRPMANRRWYPTATRLPDGRIIALSGARNSLSDLVTVPEIYDPATDTWTSRTAATKSIPLYPFMFVLPDGRLIQVGNSEVSSRTQVLDLATNVWTVVDNRLIDGGSAVQFSPGKFMKAGSAADSGNSGVSASTAFTLDMNQPGATWQPTGSMAFPRSFLNLTMLPDGTTLVTGGGTDKSAFVDANAVLPAELWSPATGAWTTLASMVTPRLYHSTAQLLPDARVLVAGGGSDAGVADHATAEILSPPYLFKGPRPSITSVPASISYGAPFTVSTPDNASIASVALIATGSVTHAFNQNQAFQTLPFQVVADGISVAAPPNGNYAPPGYYMLFIVNGSGVPSVAAFVNISGAAAPATVVVPNVVNMTQSAATTAITGAGLALGAVTTAASSTVPAGSVISQNPIAGVQVAKGSVVALVVSSGSTLVAVPNVVNATQAAATTTITGAGLVVGTVTTSSSTTVPAGTVLSQNPIGGAQVASGTAVALVVSSGPPSPSAVVDTTVFVDGRGTIVTPSVTTTAPGDLLVAFAASDGPSSGSQTVTISGAGLTWTMRQRANTRLGTAEIWTATAASTLANATVTSAQTIDGFDQSLTVVAFRAAGGVGAGVAGGAAASAPSVSLTTTRAGSLVYGVGNDWDKAITRVTGAGQAIVHQWVDSPVGDTFWVQSLSAAQPTAGAVTINITSPTTDQWNLSAIEILASAPTTVAVPNVVGLTQAAATSAITGANLVVGAITQSSSTTVPAGSVISQSPVSGASVVINSAVALVVSSGPPKVTVPNVVGLTQAAATTAITGANLVVGAITQASSTTVPAGSVISESPVSGTSVATGSAVALVVSSGPPQVTVPNVVGLTQAAATTAITGANLVVGAITQSSSTTVPAGSVISQSPVSGASVAINSTVALVVSSGPPQVIVPNVVGLTQAAATSAITGANLVVGAITQASSTTVPAGSVISQSPVSGASVVINSAVALVVSSGPPQVTVPNVVGLTQAGATTAITGANLVVGAITQSSSTTVPAGSVISQSPVSGASVAINSTVALVVSSGPPQVSVPDVVGLTQAAATTAITGANLVVGAITQASSTTVPAGSVISQSPVSGTSVATGSAVALVISSGPPQVTVPNVVGLTQAAATTAITGANLVVGAITQSSSTTVPAGSVISQSPVSGASVAINSTVALVVSSGPPQVNVPDVVGLTQTAATTAITGANLTVGAITQSSSTTVPAGSVISESPVSGTSVATGSAVALVVSSGPPQVTVPNVVGLTQTAATTAITGANLVVGAITPSSSTTVPAGSVISQSPAAGASVATDSAIALVVSTGVPQVLVVVPNVIEMTQGDASAAITDAKLVVGAVTTASSTTIDAGSVISQSPIGGTSATVGAAVDLVVSSGPPEPLGIDVFTFSDGTGTRVTAPFNTTEAGEVLVAFVASDGPNGTTRQTVTVSGAGLEWTLVRRVNKNDGTAEIWTATAPAPLVNATVTATPSVGGFDQSLTVMSFTGSSGIGGSGASWGLTNLGPNVSFLAEANGSFVIGVGDDPDRRQARTANAGQTIVHQWVDTRVNATFWVQGSSGSTAGSLVSLGDANTNSVWNMVAVEIMPR